MKLQMNLKKHFVLSWFSIVILTQLQAQPATLQWAKSVGGNNSDLGFSVATDASGNVYTIGLFNASGDFDPGPATLTFTSAGGEDIYLTKLDASGNLVWAEQFGGILSDEGSSVGTDATGNVYIAGTFADVVDFDPGPGVFNLTSTGSNDIFVAKLDSSGNLIWAKDMGGASSDYALSLALDSSDNVYTTGFFEGAVDFDPGAATFNMTSICSAGDIFISKLDNSGNFMWAKDIGGNFPGRSNSITTDGSGNVYTTGNFQGTTDFDPGAGTFNATSLGGFYLYVLKLDAAGNFIWVRTAGANLNAIGYSVKADASGNIYTAGAFQSTVDFDPGPGINNLISAGSYDGFILKLDTAGNFEWAKDIGGPSSDVADYIAIAASGNLYITGGFYSTADFDPGPGIANLTSAGSGDIFILKLDSSGSFTGVTQIGGTGNDGGISIALDDSDNIYTTGDYYATVDFDPSPATFNLTAHGVSDVYTMKMSPGVFTTTHENVLQDNVNIFPNPSSEKVNLVFDHALDHASMLLLNTTGQLVMEKENLSGNQFALDLSGVANGIYFIEVNDNGKISRIKVVKN